MRCIQMFVVVLLAVPVLGWSGPSDVTQSSVLENNVAYLRIANVDANLAGEIQIARNTLMSSNQLAGFVLDLRFAGGETAGSAGAAADLLAREKLPVAVLVNDQTHGAALDLAKRLHSAHSALVFGAAATEIKPDITVPVDTADEKSFFENPYSVIPTNAVARVRDTNDFLPFIDHTSEADLVRARVKDGEDGDVPAAERVVEPAKPFLRDPVLARGVDFIKGLAVLRLSHS